MNECSSATLLEGTAGQFGALLVTYSENMGLFVAPNSRPLKPVKPKKEDFFVEQPLSAPTPHFRFPDSTRCLVLPRCDHAKEKNQRNPGFRKSGHNPLKTSD